MEKPFTYRYSVRSIDELIELADKDTRRKRVLFWNKELKEFAYVLDHLSNVSNRYLGNIYWSNTIEDMKLEYAYLRCIYPMLIDGPEVGLNLGEVIPKQERLRIYRAMLELAHMSSICTSDVAPLLGPRYSDGVTDAYGGLCIGLVAEFIGTESIRRVDYLQNLLSPSCSTFIVFELFPEFGEYFVPKGVVLLTREQRKEFLTDVVEKLSLS